MELEPRGIVVPFRGVRKASRPAGTTQSTPRTAAADGSGAPAARPSVDYELNAEWDLLIRLATQAWSWRDPESLDVLEHTLTRLRTWIGHDWSS